MANFLRRASVRPAHEPSVERSVAHDRRELVISVSDLGVTHHVLVFGHADIRKPTLGDDPRLNLREIRLPTQSVPPSREQFIDIDALTAAGRARPFRLVDATCSKPKQSSAARPIRIAPAMFIVVSAMLDDR